MATIKEDYVSFECAKLCKEKGFNEYCPLWYNLDKPIEGPFFYKEIGWYGHNSYDYNGKRIVSAPTLQMAMKWLREVHNLFIQICIIPHTTITIEQKYYFFTIHKDRRTLAFRKDFPSEYYFTYEEACEAAIKYCLKVLI